MRTRIRLSNLFDMLYETTYSSSLGLIMYLKYVSLSQRLREKLSSNVLSIWTKKVMSHWVRYRICRDDPTGHLYFFRLFESWHYPVVYEFHLANHVRAVFDLPACKSRHQVRVSDSCNYVVNPGRQYIFLELGNTFLGGAGD